MLRIWRLGYDSSSLAYQGVGWRHLVWRFWWFSPTVERRCLEIYALSLNLVTYPDESNAELRIRIASAMGVPR